MAKGNGSQKRPPMRQQGGLPIPGPALAVGILVGVLLLLGISLWIAMAPRPAPAPRAPEVAQVPAAERPAAERTERPAAERPPAERARPVEAEPVAADDDLPASVEDEPPAPPPAVALSVDAPRDHASTQLKGQTEQVQVKRIVDGDTLQLTDGRKIRLVGINTPERGKPLYKEAGDVLRELTGDGSITLELDVEHTDQFKRTLGYLHRGDVFINGEIVRRGMAYCYTWKPNVAHHDDLLRFQQEARRNKLGLWGLPLPAPEAEYVGSKTAHRFHRPSCKKAPRSGVIRWTSRDAALDEGQNPCPDCEP